MNLVDLFAGIGGVSLAGDWAGFETVAFCEINPFCQSILRKHWPDVPIFDDICTLTADALAEAGIHDIDLLHASTPCQPFSTAGNRKGNDDHRALWPCVLRIIRETKPRAVLIENVAGAVSLALDSWLTDLEGEGYETGAVVFPAAAVGAPHRRDRLFVLAYADGQRRAPPSALRKPTDPTQRNRSVAALGGTRRGVGQSRTIRVVDGIPDWLDEARPSFVHDAGRATKRITAMGNAVVPQQVYPVLQVIAEVLNGDAE